MGSINEKLDYLAETKEEIKQAIINKGVEVADTDTFRSYAEKINEMEVADPNAVDRLQWKCDNIKSLRYEFADYVGTGVEEILIGLNTSNVTNMSNMFDYCMSLKTIPQLNTSNVTNMSYMFRSCMSLKTIPQLNTSNVTNMSYMFSGHTQLTTVTQLDMINVSNVSNMFAKCIALTNLTLKNIKITIQIGSGTSYGTLLTDESLINTAKELWDLTGSTSKTLTVSTPSKARFDAIYVKLVDITDEMIAEDQYINNKKPCVVCESTDEGAMTLKEYIVSKNWALA